jgi:hypothetical protein
VDDFSGNEIYTYSGAETQGSLKVVGYGHNTYYYTKSSKCREILYIALPLLHNGGEEPTFGDSGSAVYDSKQQLHSFLKGFISFNDTQGNFKTNGNSCGEKKISTDDNNANMDIAEEKTEFSFFTPCHLILKQMERMIQGSKFEFCNLNNNKKLTDEQHNSKNIAINNNNNNIENDDDNNNIFYNNNSIKKNNNSNDNNDINDNNISEVRNQLCTFNDKSTTNIKKKKFDIEKKSLVENQQVLKKKIKSKKNSND